ncbi:MAG: TonB-dependent receptor plug domain-containing protein [Paludibacteraceae bacterium]
MKKYYSTVFFFLTFISLTATNIRGIIRDAENGELLVGASIYLKEDPRISIMSGLDGTFFLKEVQIGEVTIVCKSLGYALIEKKVNVPSEGLKDVIINMNHKGIELKSVEVIASSRSNEFGARNLEKLSPNILNIVSANAIEISPDLDVANVLQRISGVVLDKSNNSGNAQYAVIRGMDKRYNITLVNGVKIASPNDNQRYVPLNLFPSELLDRLEVSKTRTAETEGDATGGAVNLVMKDAPAYFSVMANAALGYDSYSFNHQGITYNRNAIVGITPYEKFGKSYAASVSDFQAKLPSISKDTPYPNAVVGFSIGNRFFDGKLGLLLAGNFQRHNKGKEQTIFGDEMLQTEQAVRLTDIKYRTYNEVEIKTGLHTKLDYKFNENHKFELYNVFFYNDATQVRQSNSTNFKLYYEPDKGNADMSYQTRLMLTKQQIFASTLFGHHRFFTNFFFDWTVAYSNAGQNTPDRMYLKLDNLRQNYVDDIYFDGDGSNRIWEHNNDQDYSGLINLTYKLKTLIGRFEFRGGGLFQK